MPLPQLFSKVSNASHCSSEWNFFLILVSLQPASPCGKIPKLFVKKLRGALNLLWKLVLNLHDEATVMFQFHSPENPEISVSACTHHHALTLSMTLDRVAPDFQDFQDFSLQKYNLLILFCYILSVQQASETLRTKILQTRLHQTNTVN